MARLRLFANLREIAGESRIEVDSDTVGGAIEEVSTRFGDDFRKVVSVSRVWVNGETARATDPVGAADEIVLLPPVSGGAMPRATTADLYGLLALGVALLAVLANFQSQEIWAAAVVAVVAVWSLDLSAAMGSRDRPLAPLAVTASATVAALAAHVTGGSGYALALAGAVVVMLGWAIAFPAYRAVQVFSPNALVGLLAALGTASLVLARSAHSPDPRAADVFLFAVIAAILVGAVVERLPALPLLDTFSVTAVAAVLASVLAAVLWDLDVVGYLLVGLGLAVALVAGRGLSVMLRTGRVTLTERPPGLLVALEGACLAAVVFYPLLTLVL